MSMGTPSTPAAADRALPHIPEMLPVSSGPAGPRSLGRKTGSTAQLRRLSRRVGGPLGVVRSGGSRCPWRAGGATARPPGALFVAGPAPSLRPVPGTRGVSGSNQERHPSAALLPPPAAAAAAAAANPPSLPPGLQGLVLLVLIAATALLLYTALSDHEVRQKYGLCACSCKLVFLLSQPAPHYCKPHCHHPACAPFGPALACCRTLACMWWMPMATTAAAAAQPARSFWSSRESSSWLGMRQA